MDDHTTRHPANKTPYGYCHCGCGQKTPICTHTRIKQGLKKGEPTRFIRGHAGRLHPESRRGRKPTPSLANEYAPWVKKHGLQYPYGECQCGCGQKTSIATSRVAVAGVNKGQPYRFYAKHYVPKPREQTFWKRVSKPSPDECWEWQGGKTPDGYGSAGHKNKSVLAHRLAWELTNGPIPEGMEVCHKCDNPPCCNPDHLFLGTHADNIRDMFAKGRNNPRRGAANSNAKLTESQVKEIRSRYANKDGNTYELAQEYGVSQVTISALIRRKTWGHVP